MYFKVLFIAPFSRDFLSLFLCLGPCVFGDEEINAQLFVVGSLIGSVQYNGGRSEMKESSAKILLSLLRKGPDLAFLGHSKPSLKSHLATNPKSPSKSQSKWPSFTWFPHQNSMKPHLTPDGNAEPSASPRFTQKVLEPQQICSLTHSKS